MQCSLGFPRTDTRSDHRTRFHNGITLPTSTSTQIFCPNRLPLFMQSSWRQKRLMWPPCPYRFSPLPNRRTLISQVNLLIDDSYSSIYVVASAISPPPKRWSDNNSNNAPHVALSHVAPSYFAHRLAANDAPHPTRQQKPGSFLVRLPFIWLSQLETTLFVPAPLFSWRFRREGTHVAV